MALTILNVAYPLAPVRQDCAGGAEQILLALDRSLIEAGHESLVIACQGSRPTGRLIEIPAETGPFSELSKIRAADHCRAAISYARATWDVDLVHLHGIDFYRYVPTGVPTLITCHLPLDWYPAEALLASVADRWFNCVSFSQHEGCPPGGHFVDPIPNGIDFASFGPAARKRSFALVLARLCPEKGIHLALDAAHIANVPLIIAGSVFSYKEHQDYFVREIEPRLDRYRRFIGVASFARKRRLLAAARCLLIPSLAPETSSLVAMEALASGVPVIAFPNGALTDIVRDGQTGFLVESVTEIAAAIKRVGAIDPELCRAEAAARFDARPMIESYLRLYQELSRAPLRSEESRCLPSTTLSM